MHSRGGVVFLWLTIVAAAVIVLFAFVFGILDFSKVPGRGGSQLIPSDQQAQDVSSLSNSDEVESIETDLLNTDLNYLDEGLEEVGQESGSL